MALSYRDAISKLENSRVKSTRPLIPPQILQEDLPLYVAYVLFFFHLELTEISSTLQAAQTVLQGRVAVENILRGDDDRLMVVVG